MRLKRSLHVVTPRLPPTHLACPPKPPQPPTDSLLNVLPMERCALKIPCLLPSQHLQSLTMATCKYVHISQPQPGPRPWPQPAFMARGLATDTLHNPSHCRGIWRILE
ncbi:hypothetical protein DPEC_G00255660 [Dallia pectoralis]|uniref:Uncharacterized protein n=1 Tax=Dallia pectoralis TaxID=75939 RepID=A0ACC2FUE9_DALPE|nr:hypothetical protein DPEC_G00255660 [Dallia pectoralis]